ncbi:competence pheromone ComX [Paenibacillus solani]|uniref:competence pheromone ComX n=1 Tax=Paenibacillus solani TaxID=1705565 RepID=UPI000A97CD84|nr:competence pheromone ComX [Paenibacillus solani]
MLKEFIQALVQDAGSMMKVQSGQIQLAGISGVEQKALMDVLRVKGDISKEPMKAMYWS